MEMAKHCAQHGRIDQAFNAHDRSAGADLNDAAGSDYWLGWQWHCLIGSIPHAVTNIRERHREKFGQRNLGADELACTELTPPFLQHVRVDAMLTCQTCNRYTRFTCGLG